MPVVESEEVERNGQRGRLMTVGVKVLKKETPGFLGFLTDVETPKDRAEKKALKDSLVGNRTFRHNEFEIISSKPVFTSDRVAKEEWEVEVFRPYKL